MFGYDFVRSFAGNEVPGQKTSSQNVELALVMFNAHGSYSGCLVQRTGWTKVVDTFLQWLYAIPFGGGGFNNVAVTEGLSEALMMFSPLPPGAGQTQQSVDGNKHCILVAASDPYPLPTPVFRPQLQSAEKIENTEGLPESRLSDAEAVAKSYALCSISLSVICPKQLPKLRAIYNAGKRNPHAADTPVDAVKSTHHLVLVSDNFREAHAALSLPGTTNLMASQTPVKVDTAEITHVTGLSTTSASTVNGMNGSISNRQQINVPNIPATVKVVRLLSFSQQTSNALQLAQSKYVKVWEGNLSGRRQGQPVFITRLEGYRSASASEKLAENWPSTMQIVRVISQDHMNYQQYVGKADFLVFRAMNSHGFLGQLQEKKLCAVIQLTSQTLLLSVSDKACRLIGMLFPGDMVVFKQPQMPTQQQQQLQQHHMQQNPQLQQLQQNPQLQQLQQQQQNNQLQQQQQQQQQQHGVGTAMNQGFGQGPAQSQIAPPQGQQQVTSQVAHNMQGPGAGFMS